jgi:hypothetical protein
MASIDIDMAREANKHGAVRPPGQHAEQTGLEGPGRLGEIHNDRPQGPRRRLLDGLDRQLYDMRPNPGRSEPIGRPIQNSKGIAG